MRANSLALRLFLSATVWTVLILFVTGFVLSGLYRDSVERAFDQGQHGGVHRIREVGARDGNREARVPGHEPRHVAKDHHGAAGGADAGGTTPETVPRPSRESGWDERGHRSANQLVQPAALAQDHSAIEHELPRDVVLGLTPVVKGWIRQNGVEPAIGHGGGNVT